MVISVRVLDNKLSLAYITKLIGVSNPVSKGLSTQYFVAHDIIADLDAQIIHGKSGPDIIPSDHRLLDRLIDNSKPYSKNKEDLEIKKFAWNFKSFSSAIYSYKSRKQTQSIFIGISPVLQFDSQMNIPLIHWMREYYQ